MRGKTKVILIAVIFMLQLLLVKSAPLTLSCSVTNNCQGTPIFKMSAPANAHAENWSLNNYEYSVCCQAQGITIGNSCDTGVQVIRLSADTNAHAEKVEYAPAAYSKNICISAPSNALLSCISTTQDCQSIGYDACLATISGDANAHVADCVTDPYPLKICCKSECTSLTETACTDGLDNDCDGLVDCNDTDCTGSIAGAVKNQDGQAVSSADVSAKKDLTTVASSATNSQGNYDIASINCGTYSLVASHPNYAPQTKSNVVVNAQQQTTVNFEGSSSMVLGSSCEADCTFAADNIVHASCDTRNGCTFYDSISKSACDNSQPGWVRDYNSSHYVICAPGSPQPKIEIEASVSCASGTLVKVTSIVLYNGKPVKLVVAACG